MLLAFSWWEIFSPEGEVLVVPGNPPRFRGGVLLTIFKEHAISIPLALPGQPSKTAFLSSRPLRGDDLLTIFQVAAPTQGLGPARPNDPSTL